jgi:hypothetical protein
MYFVLQYKRETLENLKTTSSSIIFFTFTAKLKQLLQKIGVVGWGKSLCILKELVLNDVSEMFSFNNDPTRVLVFITYNDTWTIICCQQGKMYNGHALNGNNSYSSFFISNNLRLVTCICCLNVTDICHSVLMEIGYRFM